MTTLFRTLPRLATLLGGQSLITRLWLLLELWCFVISRKFVKDMPDHALHVAYAGRTLVYHLRYAMDVAVLKEVYLEKEYEWCPTKEPKVIVDLGAHFGDTTLYYHARFPQAKIIAVEPSPESFVRLQKHVASIENITAVQAAVGSVDGTATLNMGPSSLGHSLVERRDSEQTVDVTQLTLASLLKKCGVARADLIKFDIEGGEYALFAGFKPEEYADIYIGEVHTDLAPEGARDFAEHFGAFMVERDELPRGRYLMRAKRK